MITDKLYYEARHIANNYLIGAIKPNYGYLSYK